MELTPFYIVIKELSIKITNFCICYVFFFIFA